MNNEDGIHLKKPKGNKKAGKQPQEEPEQQTQEKEVQKKSSIQPLEVVYCKVCTVPPEFCMLGIKAAECKAWLQTTYTDLYTSIYAEIDNLLKEQLERDQLEKQKEQDLLAQQNLDGTHPVNEEENKTQGDEQQKKQPVEVKELKKKKKVVKLRDTNIVVISVKQRMKNKYITVVAGLEKFDVNLKDAIKKFSKKYASGCSITEDNKIEIQGDISYELSEYLPTIYTNITEDQIEVKEYKEKKEK